MKLRYIFTLFVMMVGSMTSCNQELDDRTTLSFVGDSIIARWDLQNSFSSFITTNLGKSGSGLEYIESLGGCLYGKNIVVLSGTNDVLEFMPDKLESYVHRYIDAIIATGAARIYLYEVLPRDFAGDSPDFNINIQAFNAMVAKCIADYPVVTYIQVYNDFADGKTHVASEYYNDGLHLSPLGYEILSQKLFDKL